MYLFTPPAQNPQSLPLQQLGSIDGTVVRAGTTDGIARARITLTATQGNATPQTVTADGQGRFTFKEVGPGTYRLNATRDGFVAAEHGQRGPNSPGVPISLSAQQQLRDVRIGMTENATIAGRIRNSFGEPAVNATVQALRYTYQDGRRTLNAVQSVRTNDLGEYRLFWLPPGQYVVSAQPMDAVPAGSGDTLFLMGAGARASAPPLGTGGITRIVVTGPGGAGAMPPPPGLAAMPMGRAGSADSTEVSVPVFFSNTTDSAKAAPIDLRPGAIMGGVDLVVVETRAVRLRGQVFAAGQPARGASVSIYARGGTYGGFSVRSAPVAENGSFEFRGLAPGSYELIATLNGASNAMFIANTPLGAAAGANAPMVMNVAANNSGPRMAARTFVDIQSTDIENVVLSMDTGANVAGRLTVEGRASIENDASYANVRVQLLSEPNIPPLAIPATGLNPDGTFTIAGVTSGEYRISVLGLPRNTYVKSARLGGTDILNGGIRLDRDPRGLLDIVVGTTPGTIDVVVLDDRQSPVPGVTVALVPDSSQQKRYDAYRSVTTGSDGRARIENVIPADYRIYAWEEVPNGAWTDPDFMRSFENRGVSVRVPDNGRPSVDVRVIPYKIN
jgi:hypothetical protein